MREDGVSWRSILLALVLVGAVALGVWVPSPYIVERPGPTVDTLDEIAITGAQVYDSSGQMRMLTVSLIGSPEKPLGWLALLPALIDRKQQLVPMSQVFGKASKEERNEQNQTMMLDSQKTAVAAALHELKIDFETQITVGGVVEGAPAENLLLPGDIFLRIDGALITTSSALRQEIASKPVETEIIFTVLRDGHEKELSVTTAAGASASQSVIGVFLGSTYTFPIDVEMAVEGIGGPSAGLVFSLAIYNSLTESDLVADTVLGATGTVDDEGNVGPIGGLAQKYWGAKRDGVQLFLFPRSNCNDMPANISKDMAVAPVASLEEAIRAIDEFQAGQEISVSCLN